MLCPDAAFSSDTTGKDEVVMSVWGTVPKIGTDGGCLREIDTEM